MSKQFFLPYRQVKRGLSELGVRISFLSDTQEFRVSKADGYDSRHRVVRNGFTQSKEEQCAYYTDDLEDAFLTGINMGRS